MMFSHWMGMNLVALAWLSMRFKSQTASHLRSSSGIFLPPLLQEVCALLWDMLDAGDIHPSQSPWCNAVVLVRKKDAMLCFCVDFLRLNAHTKKDSYLLPWIQDAFESMAGTAHFSTMDFKSGFWQVKMVPESQ